jgi:hypothetical protein
MEKIIRKVIDPTQQDRETYLYWQSQPIGARLSAVWDLSAAAYAFKGEPGDGVERCQHPLKQFRLKRTVFD